MSNENIQLNTLDNGGGQSNGLLQLLMLGFFVFFSMMIGLGIIGALGYFTGQNMQSTLNSLHAESPIADRNFIRANLMINHLTTFVLPSIIFTYFFYKSKWAKYLRINSFPKMNNLLIGSLLIVAAFPLAQFAYWLNLKIALPEVFVQMETSTADMVRNLLVVEHSYELWFNILIIAVIPAIGEELLFRGIIQRKLVDKLKNPHVGIWIAAFIFSAIHFQFQGFLSRMLLGGLLGYLYFWTDNLWVPIVAHFVNNAFQIIGQYFYQQGMIDVNLDETNLEVDWGVTAVALVVVIALSRWLIKTNKSNQTAEPPIA